MLKIISLVFVGLELLLFFVESDLFTWHDLPSDNRRHHQW